MATSRQAPIIQSVKPSTHLPGFRATFILEKNLPLPFNYNTEIKPDHVYLVSAPVNSADRGFEKISKKTFCMPITVYLDLLLFFQNVWPTIEKKMADALDKMRKMKAPQADKNFQFFVSGTAEYQCYFGDALFQYRQYSNSPYAPFISLSDDDDKIVPLNAKVMQAVSQDWKGIMYELQMAGFMFPDLASKLQ